MTSDPDIAATSREPSAVTVQHWMAALAVAIVAFVLVTTEYLPVGLIPGIAADLGVSYGEAGLTVTLPAMVAAAAAAVVSVVTGRMDRRLVLAAMTVVLFVGNAVSFVAPSYGVLLFGRVLVGVALGGFWPIGITVGPRIMPEPTLTRGTTVIMSGFALGMIAGVPAGTLLGSGLGWRAAFGVAGAVSLLAILALATLLPSLPPRHVARWRDLAALLTVPQARIGLLLAAVTFGGVFLAYPFLAPFLQLQARMADDHISLMLLVFGVAGFFGNIALGWLAGRGNRLAMATAAIGLAAPMLLLAVNGKGQTVTSALIAVWGAAYGGLSIVCQSWCAKAAPVELERGGALFPATVLTSVAIASWIGGEIVDSFGVVAIMVAGGIACLMALPLVALSGRATHSTLGEGPS